MRANIQILIPNINGYRHKAKFEGHMQKSRLLDPWTEPALQQHLCL
jgi:hypothetical protein